MLQLKQELLLRQMLTLTPRLIMMLKMLNLPYTDLLAEIHKQAEENVTLEITKDDELLQYARSLMPSQAESSINHGSSEDGLNIENRAQRESHNLTEHLTNQLLLEHLSDEEVKVGEALIENLDERGFLTNYKEIREQIMQELNVKISKVDKLLEIIQTFEPEGVGARNLKECLLIQVESHNFEDEQLRDVLVDTISHHLDLLNKPEALADELNITEEGAKHLAMFIEQNLSPNPAINFNHSIYDERIVPSFVLEENSEGEQTITNLEEKFGPKLQVSNQYLQILEDPNTDPETRQYVREKIAAAKEFIESVDKRRETINKITELINQAQKNYFQKGVHWLQPLQQNKVAQEIGVVPSTISRAVAEKYIQLPQTIIPVKYLLPRNVYGLTAKRIQAIMKDILDNNPNLSDQKLCNILNDTKIPLKRRTVAKYRAVLEIESTRTRNKE